MSPRPSDGRAPQAPSAKPAVNERRGWFSHGVVALTISALGIAAAGSTTLTTSAQTTSAADSRAQVLRSGTAATQAPLTPGQSSPSPNSPPVTEQEPLRGFAPRQTATEPTDERVRIAVVKEQAAQRAEELSKTAEDATRVARDAGSDVRSKELAATDRDTRETAVRIATERRRRAIAARVAAEYARKAAEAARQRAAQAEAAAAAARAAREAAESSTDDDDDDMTSTDPRSDSPPDDSDSGDDNGGIGRDDGDNDEGDSPAPPTRRSASPVPGAVIGTPFGATGLWARYHTGLDFRSAGGTPIRAVTSGVVLYAGNKGNWSGNHVAIKHSGGYTTMSSHMSSMSVRAGEKVRAGQVIGRVGATGRAFGAHLHFELYPRGVRYGNVYSAINPVPWLRANGVRTR